MTTALITGITGQDGSYLAEQLLAEGSQVHGLLLASELAATSWLPPGIDYHSGDLGQADSVAQIVAAVEPDEIYNLGGISSVAQSWLQPTQTGLVTGLGAVAVMEAAFDQQKRTGRPVRVLQASSAEIFGQTKQSPADESTPIQPVSPYGAAKAYAHHCANLFRQQGLMVSTVILYNHESPRRPTSFITRKITSAAARIARTGGGQVALGNLSAGRDWGWAPDYVRAMVLALRHPQASDYVVATGVVHSVEQLVEVAFAQVGISEWQRHVTVDPQFVRPVEATIQVGNPAKARQELGWRPTVGFEEMIQRMVDADLALLDGSQTTES